MSGATRAARNALGGDVFAFRAGPEEDGTRLGRVIGKRVPALSGRAVKALVDRGRVFVEERRVLKASRVVHERERIEVHGDTSPRPVRLGPSDLLRVDDAFVCVDKPARLPVQGGGRQDAHGLLVQLEGLLRGQGAWRAGDALTLVHRIDRDTSGVLVVARGQGWGRDLEGQFARREVEKRYLAVVRGLPDRDVFRCDAEVRPKKPPGEPGGRDRGAGERALTEVRVLERFAVGCALLEARPRTGRTHQIRVHLAQVGLPLLGDALYGSQRLPRALFRAVPRHMLHAAFIGVRDPVGGGLVQVEAPVPPDMERVLAALRDADPA